MPDQGVAGVTVVHRADPAAAATDPHDGLGFLNGHRQRLFAQHVEACLEEGLGDLEMRGVGCGYRDEVDSVPAYPLAREHILPAPVGAVRDDSELAGKQAPCGGVPVQGAGDQVELTVEQRPIL